MKSNLELMQNVVKPYIDAKNQALTNYTLETGVKNLAVLTATNDTQDGITYTVNSDESISTSGTASSTTAADARTFKFSNDTDIIMNGCPSDGSDNTFNLQLFDATEVKVVSRDYGEGVAFKALAGHTYNIRIWFGSGTTVSNKVFKPMIRSASITDPTYQPYAKTNVELTADLANSYVFKGIETKTVTGDGVKTYKQLIEELRDTVNSYVTALGSDYYIITRTIEIYSIQYDAALPKLSKILYDCKYKGFYFDGANNAHIRECFPSRSTTTYLKDLTFNTSPTISINDITNNVLDNGASIIANFEVYKKV